MKVLVMDTCLLYILNVPFKICILNFFVRFYNPVPVPVAKTTL